MFHAYLLKSDQIKWMLFFENLQKSVGQHLGCCGGGSCYSILILGSKYFFCDNTSPSSLCFGLAVEFEQKHTDTVANEGCPPRQPVVRE